MKRKLQPNSIVVNPVSFDAGCDIIAGLKQVLAHLFNIL